MASAPLRLTQCYRPNMAITKSSPTSPLRPLSAAPWLPPGVHPPPQCHTACSLPALGGALPLLTPVSLTVDMCPMILITPPLRPCNIPRPRPYTLTEPLRCPTTLPPHQSTQYKRLLLTSHMVFPLLTWRRLLRRGGLPPVHIPLPPPHRPSPLAPPPPPPLLPVTPTT
jgi:hypothetical protein